MLRFLLAIATFPGIPLAACALAECLSDLLLNTLPPIIQ